MRAAALHPPSSDSTLLQDDTGAPSFLYLFLVFFIYFLSNYEIGQFCCFCQGHFLNRQSELKSFCVFRVLKVQLSSSVVVLEIGPGLQTTF